MNVLIISLFGFGTSGRATKIANITFKGENVTAITSDFNHQTKQYYPSGYEESIPLKRLHVIPYKRNLSFARIISHISFAKQLSLFLKNLDNKPDLVYCAMPSSSAAYVAGNFCKQYDIPFVIDVIDLWPNSLIPVMPFRSLVKLCLTPWKSITNKAYKMADYISGESKKYSEIAQNINQKAPCSHTYLGVDTEKIYQLISQSDIKLIKPDDEIWIGYGGSLGQSYDFDAILNGLKYLKEKNVKYKMWFIGDGEKSEYIRHIAEKEDLNIVITGRIDYKDLLKYLSYCDIAINSFKENTLVVHSYKFNDYIASGCYVLNNLKGETAEMIDRYGIGRNFNANTFNEVLYNSIKNWPEIKSTISNNMQKLIATELDQAVIYKKLKDNIVKTIFANTQQCK